MSNCDDQRFVIFKFASSRFSILSTYSMLIGKTRREAGATVWRSDQDATANILWWQITRHSSNFRSTFRFRVLSLSIYESVSCHISNFHSQLVKIASEHANTNLLVVLTGGLGYQKVGHSNRVFSLKFCDQDETMLFGAGWDNTIQELHT